MFEANTSTRRVRRAAGENDEEGNDSSAVRSKVNDDDDNSDVEAADDVGTSAERATSNKLDEQEYDDENVHEEVKDKSLADVAACEDDEDEKEEKEDEEDQEDEGVQDLEEEGQEAEYELKVEDKIEMDHLRCEKVHDIDDWITEYEYDTAEELWCRLTLSVS